MSKADNVEEREWKQKEVSEAASKTKETNEELQD